MTLSKTVKSLSGLLASMTFATSAYANCGNGNLYCEQSSGYSTASTTQFVPFHSNSASTGNLTIDGLGANEFLQPTSCPVNVNGLSQGQTVLGCYQVMKQKQIQYHAQTQYVQVVHPIIYVRYAVPTPIYTVPVPVPTPIWSGPVCGGPMMPPPPPMVRGCGW